VGGTIGEAQAGPWAGGTHRFPLRVYFEDTDVAGIVYYANYLKYMERARSEMLRAVGVDQRAVLEAGEGVYVVAEAHLKYRRPAKLDDELIVESKVLEVRAASCVIHQRVIRGGEILVDGRIVAAFASADGRPKRQPRQWVEKFARLQREGAQ
jgi:acyl-CoA thioester hydrolase